MNKKEILENLEKYNFYHRIRLNDEIITPGINRAQISKNLKLINEMDIKNKKVLAAGMVFIVLKLKNWVQKR